MNVKEKNILIQDLMLQNDFFPFDIENCYEQNINRIENMDSIFSLEQADDVNVLMDVAELLSNEEFALEAKELLQADFKESGYEIQNEQSNKLIALTALAYNDNFFTMAWNFTRLLKSRVLKERKKSKKSEKNCFEFPVNQIQGEWEEEYADAAATEGIHSFGKEIKLDGIGMLGKQYGFDDGENYFLFYIKLDSSAFEKSFTVKISFTALADNVDYISTVFNSGKDQEEYIYSEPMDVDAGMGIKIKSIEIL